MHGNDKNGLKNPTSTNIILYCAFLPHGSLVWSIWLYECSTTYATLVMAVARTACMCAPFSLESKEKTVNLMSLADTELDLVPCDWNDLLLWRHRGENVRNKSKMITLSCCCARKKTYEKALQFFVFFANLSLIVCRYWIDWIEDYWQKGTQTVCKLQIRRIFLKIGKCLRNVVCL